MPAENPSGDQPSEIPALIGAYKEQQEANRKQEAREDTSRQWREW